MNATPRGYLRYWLQGGWPVPPGPSEPYLPLQSAAVIAAAGIQSGMQYLEGR